MRLLHAPSRTHAGFDDVNLVSSAGLVPVMRLAERCGLPGLIGDHVQVADRLGVNAPVKIGSIVAGMVAGADSIDDLDVVRHGGMGRLFGGVRAPSTLGSFLRCLSWGNARQIEKVGRLVLGRLAGQASLLPGAETLAFVDIDSTQKRVYGPAKQGAGFGHTKIQGRSVLVRGLNALAATISTPTAAPVIAAARLRGGTANSARGAASFVAEAIGAARQAGCSGTLIVRGDSAYYSGVVVAACRRADARYSFTVTIDAKVRAAIAAIAADAWRPIRYPKAVWDEDGQRWISDAEVAETSYTAFAGKARHRTTARLIVRRVKDLAAQEELFPVWRHHAIFTDNPHELIQAETQHRGHAIIEQTFADLYAGPLAHLPSGHFAANAAWLACAAIAHNLLRAAGALASTFHAKARGATLRRHLVAVPARLARHGRGQITLHLPGHWPWQTAWENLFTATHRAPPDAA
ncbi:MAG: IS1380 family transposase [Micromonosporaceae bacterium]